MRSTGQPKPLKLRSPKLKHLKPKHPKPGNSTLTIPRLKRELQLASLQHCQLLPKGTCFRQGCPRSLNNNKPCSPFFVFYADGDPRSCQEGIQFILKYATGGKGTWESRRALNMLIVPYADVADENMMSFEKDRLKIANVINRLEPDRDTAARDNQVLLKLYYGMDANEHAHYDAEYAPDELQNNDLLAAKLLCKLTARMNCSGRALAGWVRYSDSKENIQNVIPRGSEIMLCREMQRYLRRSTVCESTCRF